jgi:hypothetical protein
VAWEQAKTMTPMQISAATDQNLAQANQMLDGMIAGFAELREQETAPGDAENMILLLVLEDFAPANIAGLLILALRRLVPAGAAL